MAKPPKRSSEKRPSFSNDKAGKFGKSKFGKSDFNEKSNFSNDKFGKGRFNDDKPSFREKSDNFGDKGGFKKPAYGEKSERFGGKGRFNDEKPSFREKSGGFGSEGGFKKPAYGEKSERFGGKGRFNDEKPSFREKSDNFGDKGGFKKPAYGEKSERFGGKGRFNDDKPSFREKSDNFGDKGGFKKPAYGEKSERFGGKGRFNDDKPSFREKSGGFGSEGGFKKPAYGEKSERFGGKGRFNDDKPSFREKSGGFGDEGGFKKPAYGEKSERFGGKGRFNDEKPSFREKSERFGDKGGFGKPSKKSHEEEVFDADEEFGFDDEAAVEPDANENFKGKGKFMLSSREKFANHKEIVSRKREKFAEFEKKRAPFRRERDNDGETRKGDDFKRFDDEALEERELVFGRHPVVYGLQEGKQFEKILLLQGTRGEFEKEVRNLCKEKNVPLQVVPKERLQALTSSNHQGIIGIVSPIEYQELEDILPAVVAKGETPLFVLLDGVTDVRNIGGIARSAEIAGAHAVIVSKKNVAAINGDAMKASAGALNIIPICRVASLQSAVEYLQANGVQVMGAEMTAKPMVYELNLTQPTAIVMGAEGRGVNSSLGKQLDTLFRIPMVGKTESYNVSVATGMVLYETLRQRTAPVVE